MDILHLHGCCVFVNVHVWVLLLSLMLFIKCGYVSMITRDVYSTIIRCWRCCCSVLASNSWFTSANDCFCHSYQNVFGYIYSITITFTLDFHGEQNEHPANKTYENRKIYFPIHISKGTLMPSHCYFYLHILLGSSFYYDYLIRSFRLVYLHEAPTMCK